MPLIECLVAHWPLAARRARINVWCKQTVTPSDQVIPLEIPHGTSRHEPRMLDEVVPGVSLQINLRNDAETNSELALTIVERHSPASSGPGSLKLIVVPTADRVERHFDGKHQLVLHTFGWSQGRADLADGKLSLAVTTRKSALDGADQLAEPFELMIPQNNDALPSQPQPQVGPALGARPEGDHR